MIANRTWDALFGTGIVPTSEDFGTQGELPTHPELLDWLAVELRDSHWNIKAFLKILVTSSSYRQRSAITPEMAARDPENRLVARGPRFRLPAETIRDQALFASGLLSPKMYGPPVKPPQPSSGLSAAFGSGIDWQTSTGEDRYRRAPLYDVEAIESLPVDDHVRRPQSGGVFGSSLAHEHAVAGPRYAE